MDYFNSRYFRINKLLLSFLGLWPYQTSNMKCLVLSFSVLGPTITLLSQVMYLLEHSDDLDEMFAAMTVTCSAFINLTKVICFTCNSKKIKALLRLTQEDWDNPSKSQETQIITRYAEMGRKFTLAYSCTDCGVDILVHYWFKKLLDKFAPDKTGHSMLAFTTCYALMPFVAPVLDIILPVNETRPRKMLYPAEYLVSQEKYYYTILLSQYVGFTVSIFIATATDTTYFSLLEHICGMQTVLCYRLMNLKAHYKLGWVSNGQSHGSDGIGHRVRRCIQLDKRIRIYIEVMESAFATFLLIDIALGTILQTCSCLMIVIRAERLSEIMRFVAIAVLQSLRLFLVGWTGQEIIDHSSDIPIAAYDATWYLMPTKVQKMLMLLIARSQKPSQMILAGIYVINLESFSLVMKSSVSYCTIMISLRAPIENT